MSLKPDHEQRARGLLIASALVGEPKTQQ